MLTFPHLKKKNAFHPLRFTVQYAPYYIHRVFFDTVCPKANHSCSNSNIWTWQKWCKMGSRSHSNLFDKKGWGWGTGAWCMQRQQWKGKVFGNTDQIVCVCVSVCVVTVRVRPGSAAVMAPSGTAWSVWKLKKRKREKKKVYLLTHEHVHRLVYSKYPSHTHTHAHIRGSIAHSREIETDIAVTGPYQRIWHRMCQQHWSVVNELHSYPPTPDTTKHTHAHTHARSCGWCVSPLMFKEKIPKIHITYCKYMYSLAQTPTHTRKLSGFLLIPFKSRHHSSMICKCTRVTYIGILPWPTALNATASRTVRDSAHAFAHRLLDLSSGSPASVVAENWGEEINMPSSVLDFF